ncbi:outer membrane beta-barrel protein [Saccharicrinis sp. GN24d3]|uniref:outer membrane beta-barrel protein n=1 Tax=Saccharicrinis sp. GN24d3 TaxID=3458416 RepID=UPI004035F051
MSWIKLTVIFLLASLTILSQNKVNVSGRVIDEKQQLALPGATVVATIPGDTTFREGTIAGKDGTFSLDLTEQIYFISVSFLGFNKFTDTVTVANNNMNLGEIKLREEKSILNEVKVVSTLAPTFQKGDTTLFNPDAFRVSLDATANDLLLKMPGFYAEEGKLMAMGDTIREVLLDGKKLFGADVTQALKVIPPKIIRSIEVYQYKSEGTKHSGFEESTEGRTVNIVTNLDTDAFVRSELSAGIGKEDRFATEGYYSRFLESNRLNVNANRNNVQVPLRINRGGAQNSISGDEVENSRVGANFGLSGKTDLNVNYTLSDTESDSHSSSNREYVAGALLGQTFLQDNNSISESNGHNIGLSLGNGKSKKKGYNIHLSFGKNKSKRENETESETRLNKEVINASTNKNLSHNDRINVSGDFNYMHKLNDKGRALSVQMGYSYNDSEGNNKQVSQTRNGDGDVSQSINQFSESKSKNTDITLAISFNEKLGKNGLLSLGYKYRNYNQESDKRTMNFDEASNEYAILDSLTSSNFDNLSDVHIAKLGFRHDKGKIKTYAGIDIKNTTMESIEVFPDVQKFKEEFISIRPNAKFSYTTKSKRNYTLNYGLRQSIPSLNYLQEIVNNSNPLYISTGNPNLKLSSTHQVTFSMSKSDMKKASFITLQLRGGITNNMVTQDRVVAHNDTVVLGSYFLPAGGQLSSPVNLDGQYSLGMNGIYSLPIKKLKSKLNSRTGISYNRTPNILNGVKNNSSRISLSQSFTMASNIHEKIDFTLTSRTNYSFVENNISTSSQSGTFSQRTGINLYYNFYKKFIFKSNTSQSFTGAYGSLKSKNRWFVNLGLSKKLFADNQGEISFSMYDLANDQSDVTRDVSDLYISESYNPTLNKFYMLSFSYSL